jgi:hypothetical protein
MAPKSLAVKSIASAVLLGIDRAFLHAFEPDNIEERFILFVALR